MKRPLLLDLFCGAGGAAMGYYRAGFDVVGVDIKPQPRYPFRFIQADALKVLDWLTGNWDTRSYIGYQMEGIDAIHASPPCQFASTMRVGLWQDREHENYIPATRERLLATSLPYVIENVENARRHLISPLLFCGTMFNLGTKEGNQLRRHRYFEIPWGYWLMPSCAHNRASAVPVYGGGQNGDYHDPPRRPKTIGVWGHAGGASTRDGVVQFGTDARREAMGIDWMTGNELSEAIPPAYTEFIGKQLLSVLRPEGVTAHGDTSCTGASRDTSLYSSHRTDAPVDSASSERSELEGYRRDGR